MNELRAITILRATLDEHKLDSWSVGLNDRLTRTLGRCRHHMCLIELSGPYVRANPEETVMDTILHEVAHALCGPDEGHGWRWRAKARELGAKPTRCAKVGDYVPFAPWQATCPGCERSYDRVRPPRRPSACRPCMKSRGGKWDDNLALQWERV